MVYGWDHLQNLIAQHEDAYRIFHPASVSTTAPQGVGAPPELITVANLAALVVEGLRAAGVTAPASEGGDRSDEDPRLHARIDVMRDLLKERGQLLVVERMLQELLTKEDLSSRPWARFRIETNLASIALDSGRDDEAARRFELAHSICPEDSNALANLALARTVQGRFDEAMEAAARALERQPRADQAVTYLLQAGARSSWAGAPEDLVPTDLVGSAQADLGLAEFLRRRDCPDWAERSLVLARKHPDREEFRRVRAVAVLALAIASRASADGMQVVDAAELNEAADTLKAQVETCLDIGYQNQHDLKAHLNNAGVLLRLCGRHAETEQLLTRGLAAGASDPPLRRLLALARLQLDDGAGAIKVLDADDDPESRLLRAELRASEGDFSGALAGVLAVSVAGLSPVAQQQRWCIAGELAQRLGDVTSLDAAIAGLRALDPNDLIAAMFEIREASRTATDSEVAQDRLRALASSVTDEVDLVTRITLATELHQHALSEEASRLLEDHVDLASPNPGAALLLETLAAGRRDTAFAHALARASTELCDDPRTLWTVAAHAWNQGDLEAALTAVDTLLDRNPADPRPRLLRIEVLLRQDRAGDLLAEFSKRLEDLAWKRPEDQFRVALLLAHFGFRERATSFAYRLFLEHRDMSRAWTTLSALVLEGGRERDDEALPWETVAVKLDAAVDLVYEDGEKVFFVVEPDAELRRLDQESWEPEHALVRATMGLAVGANFVGPDGRKGSVQQVRHKFVARLHVIMEGHEARFPEVSGFKRILIDAERPGGLDGLIDQLRQRRDWIQAEEAQYLSGQMPLGVFAHRVGMDTIEVAIGLAEHGAKLRVAEGNDEERVAAVRAIDANAGRGCVLDLLAFWTAWRLGAIETVTTVCGPVHLPRSVLDQLLARRERLARFAHDGQKTAGLEGDRVVVHELSPEATAAAREDLDRMIDWIENNATVTPVVVSDGMHQGLRDFVRAGHSDLLDSLMLSQQLDLLLVSDDLWTRQLDCQTDGDGGAWLHAVLRSALERQHTTADDYVRWSAHLVDFGQGFLGVTSGMLLHALRVDARAGTAPGALFHTLSQQIGGEGAEPVSHARATGEVLYGLWRNFHATLYRARATGHLLEQLLRNRQHDRIAILRLVIDISGARADLLEYILSWMRGHFIPVAGSRPDHEDSG